MTLLVAVSPAHAVNYQLFKTYPDPNPRMNSRFGEGVAVNGSRVVILDARFPTFQTGTAHVFDRDTGNQLTPLSHDGLGGSNVSVRTSGPYFVIGAPGAVAGSGRVYVYEAATGDRVATLVGNAGSGLGRSAVAVGDVVAAAVNNYNVMPELDAVEFWDIKPASPTFQQRLRRVSNPATKELYYFIGHTLGVSGATVIAGEWTCGTCPNGRGAFVLDADRDSPTFGSIISPVIDRGATTDALNDGVIVDAASGIGFLRTQVSPGENYSVEAIDVSTRMSVGQVASSSLAGCTTGGGFFGNKIAAIPLPGFNPLLAGSCITNKSAVVFRGWPLEPRPPGTFPQTLANPDAFTEPGSGPALSVWGRYIMVGNALFRDEDAAVCGDGSVEGGEECDDGNTTNGDCCSSTCSIEPAGSVCRARAGPCDLAETCPGTGVTCPPDRQAERGTPCGSQATSSCDAADTCDGQGVCMTNPTAAGTACTDDGNVCTDDACDGAGGCQHVANTAACDDGDACTRTDTCGGGVCVGSNPVSCPAADRCREAGVCDPRTGACSVTAMPDGTACDDDNACTSADTCRAGSCTGGAATPCADGDPCTTDRCDATAGCTHQPAQDGAPCDDGQECTENERCVAGSCAGGTFACGRIDTKPEVRAKDPILKVTCQTAGDDGGTERGSCEVTGFAEPGSQPAGARGTVAGATAGVGAAARVEALDQSDAAAGIVAPLEPVTLAEMPSGAQVTRSVRRRLNRRGRATVKLRLNRVGKRLLKQSGNVRVRLVVGVRDRTGRSTTLQLLVNLLRRRR